MCQRRCAWRAALGGAVCVLLTVTALLLWGRLKLVTGVPRTAYADPEAAQVEREQAEPEGK
jgi:hypothetical protein